MNRLIDAVPVVQGKWKEQDYYDAPVVCTICAYCPGFVDIEEYKYCPNCGAKMETSE